MVRAVLKFARIRVTAMLWAIAFLGSAASGEVTEGTVLTLAILLPWYVHATSINDYADHRIDRINLKHALDRPLVKNSISRRGLWTIHAVGGLAALTVSAWYGTSAVLLTAGVLVVDYAYSLRPFRISDRGIVAQLLLALAYVYYPLSLGYLASGVSGDFPWLLSVGLYAAFVALLLLKDFRDVKGDKRYGKMTFLLRHGTAATVKSGAVLWTLSAVAVITAAGFSMGIVTLLALGLLQVLILSRALISAKDIYSQQDAIVFISKSANAVIIALLAFFLAEGRADVSSAELTLIPAVIGSALLVFNAIRYANVRASRAT